MVDISRYAELGDNAHINLRSFKADGTAVDTPVWFVERQGKIFLRTVRSSAKVRRMLRNDRVQYAPCQWNGSVTGEWKPGRARILDDGDPVIPEVHQQMQSKYGHYRDEMTALMERLQLPLCYVEISPTSGATHHFLRDND